jgi:hypothetical protein
LELTKALPSDGIACVSDPPYGMDYNTDGNRFTLGGRSFPRVCGDNRPFDPTPFLVFDHCVLWGFNHFPELLYSGGTLVWIKRSDAAFGCFLSDAEVAWVQGTQGVYCYRDIWHTIACEREHPTEKPVGLMEWCIVQSKAPPSFTILDPYAGVGSTLIAAKKLGRHFLGFEVVPEYVQAARDRIARVEAQPSLFEPKPEQLTLGDD